MSELVRVTDPTHARLKRESDAKDKSIKAIIDDWKQGYDTLQAMQGDMFEGMEIQGGKSSKQDNTEKHRDRDIIKCDKCGLEGEIGVTWWGGCVNPDCENFPGAEP